MNAAPIIPRYAVSEKGPLLGEQFQGADNPMLALARSEGHKPKLPAQTKPGMELPTKERAKLRQGILSALKDGPKPRAQVIDAVPGLTAHLFREIMGGIQADGLVELHNRKPPLWVLK